jgi:alpha-tubulin suppressor-like RCC1 family protein
MTITTDMFGTVTLTVMVSDSEGLTAQTSFALFISPEYEDVTLVCTDIATGDLHSLALMEDGTVYSWGDNNYGQLGNGSKTDSLTPVMVNIDHVIDIAAGDRHSIALKNDGTVWTWGRNNYGEIGDGTNTTRTSPVQVLSNVINISGGYLFTLAIKNDGTAWAWGYNNTGQLGDDTTSTRFSPVQVSTISNVAQISAGDSFALALINDGTVWGWGANYYGEVGDGTTTTRNIPVQISGFTGISIIDATKSNSFALKSDGSIWGWGRNNRGQIGDGTTSDRQSPVEISGMSNIIAISTGDSSGAVKNDGTLWTWGYNLYGQLGDGTTTSRNAPGQVLNFSDATNVSGSGYAFLVLKSNGTVWACGRNDCGQLGDGTTINSSEFIQVNLVKRIYYPIVRTITDTTINEDATSTIVFTAADMDSSSCMSLTLTSSDPAIVPDENLSYVCDNDTYTITVTPATDQSGQVTISVLATDSDSLTATQTFDLTITSVNDSPIFGSISNQTTDNRTTLSAVSLTVTDDETATCSLTLSLTSSDTNIFASNQMTTTCAADTFYMSFTPSMQYFGTTTITAMVTDAGGLTASTTFDIEVTSTGPNYAPVIGARVDRWMDINLRNANGIWVYDENHIFVVGSYGDIMHYDGERMTPMHSPVNKEWFSVWGTSPTNVYCVGADGKILHYNGRVWTQETSCTRNDLYEVWGFNANSVYVAGEDSDICHYTGTTWPMLTAPYNTYIRGIWGTSDANMYFADSYDVAISYDGSAWGLVGSIGSRNFHDAWGADASNIWFVGDNGNVQHYNGSTITDQTMGSTNSLFAIWGSDVNNVFALGQSGSVKYYNGSSWSEIGNNSELYKDAWGIDATHVYAVTTYGKIYKYTGTTFELDYQNFESNVYGIWANSDTDVYLSGYSRMHHFDGTSWTEISANATSELNAVWSNGSIAWAVGDNGYVFYYDGSTLTRDTGITGSRLYDVWGSSANDVFAVGETGLIRHYNGSTWSVMSSGTTEHLKGVYGTASNNVIAVGENGTILRYNGSTWTSESSGITESINGIWVNNASDIYVVGNNGSVLNYNGSTWQEFGKRSGQNLNGVWGNGSGDIYVVGNFGSILHYDGTLWNTTFTGESFDLYDISGYGDTVMLVGDYRTVKQLYDYNYSETISKSIAVNATNEPIPIHVLDYNGDTISISAVSSDQSILPDGNISITGTGTDRTILVSPLTDQYGTLTLTVSVDDGLSQTTTQILLTVSQPPVIASISPQSVPEDTVFNLSLPVSGTDADTCGLQVKAFSNDTDLIREMMTDCQDGNYTLTIRPVPAQNGVTTITVTAANTAGAYTEQSFSLTVTPVNDAPNIGISSDSWTAPLRGIKQIKAFSDGSVVAVNNCGKIYHYINQQWQLVPSGIYNNINTIWGQDSSSIYVGGYQGKILHFDGSSWTTETTGISYEIYGIWGSASDDIFAVAQSGSIIHYDGSSWSTMTSGVSSYLYGVDGNASNDVFACGQSGTIIHYDGSSWSAQTSDTSNNLNQILCMGTNAVFARGGYEILSYNGSTWSSYSTASTVQYLWGLSANDVYAVCGSGNIYHFDGSSWSEMTSFTSENLMSIWGRSATDIYVVTYEGSIFHYDGLNWTERPENLTQSYSHVTGTDNEVFAAGNYGIYKYNGINWTESSMDVFWERFINNTNAPVELKIMPDGRIIGANSSYFSQYDGNGWTVENTGFSVAVKDIWSDGTVIYIVGYAGTMIYYDGASWSKLTTGVTTDFYCIWGTRKDNIYLGSNYGLIYHYDGTTFTEIALDTPDTIHTIWGSGFSDIYAGSSYQKFFHYNGQEWQQMDSWISSGNAIFSIHGRHSRDIYLAGGGGGISYNNGFCWSPMTTGTTGYFRTIWHQKADEIYAGGSSGLLAQSDGQSVTIIDPIVFDAYSDIDGSADYVIATGPHENLIRYAPIISIPDQTFYADSLVHSIPIVVSDADGDSVTVSVTSSSLTLLNADSLSLSGTGSSYAILITPTVHSSLPITITVSAYDGSLTQNENFMLYLRKMNEPPELAIISNVGTAAGEISFTFVEADGDTVSLTVTSSDQSLIADGNIQIVGGTGNTTILATSAYIEQNVTIQLNQESNVHGLATITVTASATGGTVTETFNVIVSPPGSGNALAFDGDDDFVTFGSISGSHPLALAGSQFSMSFWIKPAFNNSVSQRLIDKSTNTYGTDGYSLYLYTGYRLKFALNGQDRFTTEENSLKPNLWQHVVITADASQYKCYVNGMTVGMTILDVFELPPNATANLYLGTWYSESNREYNGEMDEVSLWNRALSETDIRDLMCQRLIGTENGLLAYYRFDHVSGTVLSDLSGNNYNGTLTNMDNTDWVTSCAALGDNSHYDYNGSVASDFSVTLSHSDGDAFTAVGDSGSYSGLQVYLVNESPSSYTAPAGFSGLYTDHYFGVFPVGITPTYSIAYNYSGNTSIASENGLRLASRSNQAGSWADSMANVYTSTTTISKTGISAFNGISATEFIPGGNLPPSFGSVSGQTIYEDSALISLPIVVTDSETATCSLGITFNTSQPALLSVADISYTCNADTIYISLTPVANQSGTVDVVIIASDAAGLASSAAFVLTVTDINDAPVMSSISPQTTDEDIAIDSIAFTATDLETAACGLNITFISSDPTLISDTNLSYSCDADQYTITALPETNQNGVATITVIVADSGGLTTWTSFDLTVTAVNDVPSISMPMNYSTIEEDNVLQFDITLSDVEGDSLTVTTSSSNTSLLPDNNITFTGTGTSRSITITPTANESGSVTIAISVFDGDLTSTTSFALTVLNVNDPPQMGSIADQTTLEDIATSMISFTVTDNETAACSMTLIMTSSDPTLVPDEYLLSMCSGNEYSIVATPAMDQYGMATISVTIADAGGLAASTSFDLTVTDVDDSQYIWTNHQAADVVLGQLDFTSSTAGATDTLFEYPSAIAVDPTTGKVFICDRFNHRILRFSATNAAINGASAEAVLGQVDFNSVLPNRGGSAAANTLNAPNDLVVDHFGRLWVSDWTNNRVLRFDHASSLANGADADGVFGQPDFVTTSIGTTQNKMKEPTGIWIDPAGRLWVAEKYNHRVVWFDNAASKTIGANADGVLGQTDFNATASGASINTFNRPLDVIGDNAGNIFIADANDNRLLRFDNGAQKANGANADAVLGQTDFNAYVNGISENQFSYPLSCVMDNCGRLYVCDINNHRILIFNDAINKSNGADADYVLGQADFTTNVANSGGGISARSINTPLWIFFDTMNNHLWVADSENSRVLRYQMQIKTPPIMSLMNDLTIDEDEISNAISFTVTDINEQALTITYQSSDTSLVSATGISFSGNEISTDGTAYTVSATAVASTVTLIVTPESNQSGTCTITITMTDPNGMTATQSFSLTVTSVNDVPTLSTVDPQIMNEGTSINITLTTADIEGDALSVTVVSSNQSLIQDGDILLTNDGDTYTITITPLESQAGSANITVSVSDGTDITSITFLITVNEVYYMIAGHVSVYSDIASSDLEGVTLTLSGTHSYSMVTDATGYYTFATVRPGDYTLTASKSDDINLDVSDAVKILIAVVRKISLTCMERIAADAYDDGRIGMYDASRVLNYVVGFENCLNDSCTFWQFTTENITSCATFPFIEFESTRRYTDLTGDAVGQDFIGIGCGNVAE